MCHLRWLHGVRHAGSQNANPTPQEESKNTHLNSCNQGAQNAEYGVEDDTKPRASSAPLGFEKLEIGTTSPASRKRALEHSVFGAPTQKKQKTYGGQVKAKSKKGGINAEAVDMETEPSLVESTVLLSHQIIDQETDSEITLKTERDRFPTPPPPPSPPPNSFRGDSTWSDDSPPTEPNQCPQCKDRFSHITELNAHLQSQHGIKVRAKTAPTLLTSGWCCVICKMRFSEYPELRDHWVVHKIEEKAQGPQERGEYVDSLQGRCKHSGNSVDIKDTDHMQETGQQLFVPHGMGKSTGVITQSNEEDSDTALSLASSQQPVLTQGKTIEVSYAGLEPGTFPGEMKTSSQESSLDLEVSNLVEEERRELEASMTRQLRSPSHGKHPHRHSASKHGKTRRQSQSPTAKLGRSTARKPSHSPTSRSKLSRSTIRKMSHSPSRDRSAVSKVGRSMPRKLSHSPTRKVDNNELHKVGQSLKDIEGAMVTSRRWSSGGESGAKGFSQSGHRKEEGQNARHCPETAASSVSGRMDSRRSGVTVTVMYPSWDKSHKGKNGENKGQTKDGKGVADRQRKEDHKMEKTEGRNTADRQEKTVGDEKYRTDREKGVKAEKDRKDIKQRIDREKGQKQRERSGENMQKGDGQMGERAEKRIDGENGEEQKNIEEIRRKGDEQEASEKAKDGCFQEKAGNDLKGIELSGYSGHVSPNSSQDTRNEKSVSPNSTAGRKFREKCNTRSSRLNEDTSTGRKVELDSAESSDKSRKQIGEKHNKGTSGHDGNRRHDSCDKDSIRQRDKSDEKRNRTSERQSQRNQANERFRDLAKRDNIDKTKVGDSTNTRYVSSSKNQSSTRGNTRKSLNEKHCDHRQSNDNRSSRSKLARERSPARSKKRDSSAGDNRRSSRYSSSHDTRDAWKRRNSSSSGSSSGGSRSSSHSTSKRIKRH